MKLCIQQDPLGKWAFDLPQSVIEACSNLGYTKVPGHLHEILFFTALYSALYVLSGLVSPYVLPAYRKLSKRNKLNFDMHVVSHIQAILLCSFAWAMFFDESLDSLSSSTPFSSMAVSSAVGYFLWDMYVSVKYQSLFGLPFLFHAAAALFTFTEALRPFLHNYAAPFMLYEMSTPFVNIHWFATHVPGMIPVGVHQINGLLLLGAFFVFRIVMGSYFGIKLFTEAFEHRPEHIPSWSLYLVLTTYATLSLLNFFWFSKMIRLAIRTFKSPKVATDAKNK